MKATTFWALSFNFIIIIIILVFLEEKQRGVKNSGGNAVMTVASTRSPKVTGRSRLEPQRPHLHEEGSGGLSVLRRVVCGLGITWGAFSKCTFPGSTPELLNQDV